MRPRTTWILVCDASRARLLAEPAGARHLTEIEAFEHAESRARVRDLMADANGRKPGGGWGHRPGVEPDTDPKEVEAQKFARRLADVLQKGLDDHAYEALILVAPPHFLGLMRECVSAQVAKRVGHSIGKDVAMETPREIEARLRAERGF